MQDTLTRLIKQKLLQARVVQNGASMPGQLKTAASIAKEVGADAVLFMVGISHGPLAAYCTRPCANRAPSSSSQPCALKAVVCKLLQEDKHRNIVDFISQEMFKQVEPVRPDAQTDPCFEWISKPGGAQAHPRLPPMPALCQPKPLKAADFPPRTSQPFADVSNKPRHCCAVAPILEPYNDVF